MPEKFKPGDVVKLKSGGPKMTVVKYDLYGMGDTEKSYMCRWFDDKQNLTERTFTGAELVVPSVPAPVAF